MEDQITKEELLDELDRLKNHVDLIKNKINLIGDEILDNISNMDLIFRLDTIQMDIDALVNDIGV